MGKAMLADAQMSCSWHIKEVHVTQSKTGSEHSQYTGQPTEYSYLAILMEKTSPDVRQFLSEMTDAEKFSVNDMASYYGIDHVLKQANNGFLREQIEKIRNF